MENKKNNNKLKIKLICDGMSSMTPLLIEQFNIENVPLYVSINDNENYLESDLDINGFLKRLKEDDKIELIKTAGCNPNDFKLIYDKYINDYDIILHLSGSSKASCTYQSSVMAREMMNNKEKIIIFDTETIAIGGTLLVHKAIELINGDMEISEIMDTLSNFKNKLQVFFTVETLDYLKKCGRISFSKIVLANVLSLKPIMHIKDGKPYLYKQVRGTKKTLKHLVELVKEEYNDGKIYIIHGISNEKALKLKEQLSLFIKQDNIELVLVSPRIAVQVDCDGYGFSY